MAAFAFIRSLNGTPVTHTSSQRRAVEAEVQVRSPGRLEIRRWGDAWGAFSGALGGIVHDGGTTLFCDGFPETRQGRGHEALFQLLSQRSQELEDLEEYEGYGPGDHLLHDVTGSFSACHYDGSSGDVFLLRDRMGTRPLFWAVDRGHLFVASECSILQALGLELSLDPEGLDEAFRYRWLLESNCIFAPASRVAPGRSVFFRNGEPPRVRQYWRFRTHRVPNYDGAMEDFQDEIDAGLRSVLRKAAAGGKRAGLLLSGGVDSSVLAALCAQELENPVAYCGFIPGYDNEEWERAKFVADHVGMEFRSVEIDPNLFLDDFQYIGQRVQELPRHVNTLVLMQIFREAENEVDVLFQGDAADTLFGLRNLHRLRHHAMRSRQLRFIPKPFIRALIRYLEWSDTHDAWYRARVLAFPSAEYLRVGGALHYRKPARKVLGISQLDTGPFLRWDRPPGDDPDELKRIHLLATGVDGSLIRHDRLTRPLGIESQCPFLTPTLVDIASRMPLELCYDEVSKPALRGLLDRYLPPEVSRWKKVGFLVPEREWLFGPIFPLFEEAQKAIPPTGVLPVEYFHGVLKTEDREGVISAMYLFVLMKHFGML